MNNHVSGKKILGKEQSKGEIEPELIDEWIKKLGGISEVKMTLRIPRAYLRALQSMCRTGQFWQKDVQDYCNSEVMAALVDLFHQDTLVKYATLRPVSAGLVHLQNIEEQLPEGVERLLLNEIWKDHKERSSDKSD